MERIAYRNYGRFCDAENALTLQKRIYVLKKLISKNVKALYVDVIRFIERLKVALGIKAQSADTRRMIDRLAGATRKDGNGLYVKTVDIVALFEALTKTLITAGVVIGGSAAGYMAYKHQNKARELAGKAAEIAKPGAETAGKVVGSAIANAGIGAVKGAFSTLKERGSKELDRRNAEKNEAWLQSFNGELGQRAQAKAQHQYNQWIAKRNAQYEARKAKAEQQRKAQLAKTAREAVNILNQRKHKQEPSVKRAQQYELARDRYDYMW